MIQIVIQILIQAARLITAYFLPYFSAYLVVKRIERHIKLRITPYFYFGLITLVLYSFFLYFAGSPSVNAGASIKPRLLFIGGLIAIFGIFLLFLFVIKLKQHIFNISITGIAVEGLKIYSPLGVIIGMMIYLSKDFEVGAYLSAIIGLIFVMHSYIDLGLIYKRFQIKEWFLFIFGGVFFLGMIGSDVMVGTKLLMGIEEAYTWVKFGDACSWIGGAVATVPSLILYANLRRKIYLKFKPEKLNRFLEKSSKLMGSAIFGILELGIKRYNKKYSTRIKLTSTEILGLIEEEAFTEFIISVFADCIGPVAYRIEKEIS